MKKFLIATLVTTMFFSVCFAQHYKPVDEKSQVQFKVSHQMIFKSTVTGSFKGLKGSIAFDAKDLSASTFEVSVETVTINTGIGMRDNDLKKEKYFDVQKYPEITIKSRAITKGARDNEYVLAGILTMKGKSLPVVIPFTVIEKNSRYTFKGQFHINRLDFNIGPDNAIGKDVEIDLSVNAE